MGLIQFTDAPGGVSSSGAKAAARQEDVVLLLELAWKTWLRMSCTFDVLVAFAHTEPKVQAAYSGA